ncbi:hypothetical protein OG921_10210 [Aldersonia sp. NBC_00410]|uniref:DUF7144 family membrane protein n=1 Tax=Aldersonia sp. NBC_00410 TaxID=2975954 RepID=UPI002256E8AB|nr:hypothetical protein [Aldersonia sp. NBC_00410]MCX5043538.1 hypothetical protein [Aldersonia sp. NBC_00410]
MTTGQPAPDSTKQGSTKQAWAGGTSLVAGVLLLVVGLVSVLQGISAVASDEIFVKGIDYIYKFDTTAWGWIHIVVGILVIAAALGLFTGAAWARIAAVVIASLSIVANFLWIPWYPLWAILIIALDIVVIWAVTTWNPDL